MTAITKELLEKLSEEIDNAIEKHKWNTREDHTECQGLHDALFTRLYAELEK